MTEARNLTSLETALLAHQPSKLIVLQYDNALACLRSAIKAIERGDIEARCHSVNAAIEIISDLYMWLDHDNGGDLAENLGTIYSYMIWNLPTVNFRNDRNVAEEMMRLLKQLRTSWVKVDSQLAHQLTQPHEAEAGEIARNAKAKTKTPAQVA